MNKKITALFCFLTGIAMIGLWTVLLATDNVPEIETAPVSIIFHIISEFGAALFLLASGIGLILNKTWANRLFLFSIGALFYAVINAIGYYGQLGDFAMIIMFITVFSAAVVFVCLRFGKKDT